MFTSNSDLYGSLPIFPCLDYPSRLTEERIERIVERLMDCADRILMNGLATQAQYDRWTKRLDGWSREQYSKIRPITEIDDGMGGTYRPGVILSL